MTNSCCNKLFVLYMTRGLQMICSPLSFAEGRLFVVFAPAVMLSTAAGVRMFLGVPTTRVLRLRCGTVGSGTGCWSVVTACRATRRRTVIGTCSWLRRTVVGSWRSCWTVEAVIPWCRAVECIRLSWPIEAGCRLPRTIEVAGRSCWTVEAIHRPSVIQRRAAVKAGVREVLRAAAPKTLVVGAITATVDDCRAVRDVRVVVDDDGVGAPVRRPRMVPPPEMREDADPDTDPETDTKSNH